MGEWDFVGGRKREGARYGGDACGVDGRRRHPPVWQRRGGGGRGENGGGGGRIFGLGFLGERGRWVWREPWRLPRDRKSVV